MYTVNVFLLLPFAASSVCCADYTQMPGSAALCLAVSVVSGIAVSEVLGMAVSEVLGKASSEVLGMAVLEVRSIVACVRR